MGPESCKADGDGDRLVLLGGDDGVDHHLLDNACCDRPFCKIVTYPQRQNLVSITIKPSKLRSSLIALDRRIGSIKKGAFLDSTFL